MATKHFCDMCGKEGETDLIQPFSFLGGYVPPDPYRIAFDACKDCKERLLTLIENQLLKNKCQQK